MFVCCECCVLSGRGLCDELITRPEESYRMWCVVVFDLETSRMRRSWPALGRSATRKKINKKNELQTKPHSRGTTNADASAHNVYDSCDILRIRGDSRSDDSREHAMGATTGLRQEKSRVNYNWATN
jgi:hypothetical protein